MIRLDEIPPLLLSPLEGKGDEVWLRSPGPGVWSPGQVVDHVTTSIELSARGLRARLDKPPMTPRPRSLKQRLLWLIVSRTGLFGPRRKNPETTTPAARPERASTERRLREGVAALIALENDVPRERADGIVLKHPVFGDLTLPQWLIFHARHVAHHARQVRERA